MSLLGKLFSKKPKFEPYKVDTEFGEFTMEYYENDMTRPAYAFLGWADGLSEETQVELYCDNNESFEMKNSLGMLRQIMSEPELWVQRAKQAAADGFINKDNMVETWISDEDGNEIPIPPEEFMATLSIFSITISESRDIEVCLDGKYNGMDYFGEHCIIVNMDSSGRMISCSIG